MKKDDGKVTLQDLITEVSNKSTYKDKIIKEVIIQFLDELKDSMIENEQVSLKGYFAFRHHIQNPRSTVNLYTGERIMTPEMMKFKTNVSTNTIKKLNEVYKRENRRKKTLNNNRLTDLD